MQYVSSLFILLLAVQVTLLNSQNTKCGGGEVLSEGKCIDCPPGTYRFEKTPNVCVECPPGRYNPLKGAGSKRLCRICPENSFADKSGSTQCKPCSENTVSNEGATKCQACGPGSELISNRCRPCDAGSYNNKTATLQCDPCPEGGPEGASSIDQCKPCPPGRFDSSCRLCNEGTFKTAGVIGTCELCQKGSVSKPGSVSCQKCPAGKFSRAFFQEKCRPCPEGTTSNGPGAGMCRAIGSTTCPSETFENANGDCENCRAGFFQNVKTNFCERCPLGSVSKGGTQKKCTKCLPGQTTDDFYGQACICPDGLYRSKNGTCKPCPPGTGGNYGNVFGRDGCIKCSPGRFSNERGSARCKSCPLGRFAAEEGARRCKKCPRGSTSNPIPPGFGRGANSCILIRTGCPLGTVPARNVFGDRTCKRQFCQVGTPQRDIGFLCTPCEPGFFLTAGKCKICPKDAVSPGGIITSCKKCKNGLVRSFFDRSKCACDGEPGDGKGIQDGFCKDCPPGTAANQNISVCRPCSLGFFANGTGNSFCERCPSGTVADVVGTSVCKPCPKGTIPAQAIGAKECIPKA